MREDLSQGAAWIAGEILPIGAAKIGVTDWALIHSDVVYDVVPVWEGGFFRLGDYLDRFEASMRHGRFDVGLSRYEIAGALHDMVARSGLRAAYVAMVAARGVPLIPGSRDPRDCGNHFYAWCVPFVHVVKPGIAERGAEVCIARSARRIPDESVNQRAKNYHWGDFTQGLFEAAERGFETVVLLDREGNLAEGPGFNVFAVSGDRVVTPAAHVLHGITRRTALEMAREAGLATEERALPAAELMQADEVFLSTSGGGIVPVRRIDDRVFCNGAPGPVATRLRARYFELLRDPAMRSEIDYP